MRLGEKDHLTLSILVKLKNCVKANKLDASYWYEGKGEGFRSVQGVVDSIPKFCRVILYVVQFFNNENE